MEKKKDFRLVSFLWAQIIEEVLQTPSVQNKTLSWIRVDQPEDPTLSYTLVFARGRCLCIRFALHEHKDAERIQVVSSLGLTYTFLIGRNAEKKNIAEYLFSFISTADNEWNQEDRFVDKMEVAIQRSVKKHFGLPLTKIYKSSVHEDFHKGIDAWMIYQNKPIPLQIKSSMRQVLEHVQAGKKIPVLLNTGTQSDNEMIRQLIEIAERYLKI